MVLCSTIPLCSLSYAHAHVGNVEKYYRFPTGKIKRIILLIDFYRKKKDLVFFSQCVCVFARLCCSSSVRTLNMADVGLRVHESNKAVTVLCLLKLSLTETCK